ncbi:MAG: DUF3102 domain-containing protein [Cyanothece sp. SIO1E1]|nr:DUF3102 domain-containing protein [Cyanothece sp. SIO1E1]
MVKSKREAKIVAGFDYEVLTPEQRAVILRRTGEIRERLQRSAQDIWEIGQSLADVRSRLKRGQFLAWLKAEFNWSQRTAYNFINVYEMLPERANLEQLEIATSALYLLASPSTSEDVREQFLKRAQKGEKITHKDLHKTIKQEKPTPNVTPPVAASLPSDNSKPEIVAVISKSEIDVQDSIPATHALETSTFESTAVIEDEIHPGWYLLGKQHLLFCGDTAAPGFIKRSPEAELALAITSSDWDHDWLIERAKNITILDELTLKEDAVEQLILMFSAPKDIIIFPWLPHQNMLAIAHKLGRQTYAGDLDPQNCLRAMMALGLEIDRL